MLKVGSWVICLAIANTALAAPPEDLVRVSAEWDLTLSASGKVTALEAKPGRVKDALRKVLETAIRGWEFEPGSVNGRPAATDTNLDVSISVWLTPGDETFSVRIDKVQTGGGIAKIDKMPRFQLKQFYKARDTRTNPVVLVELIYDEMGKPGEIKIAEQSPVKEGYFATEAIKAIRTWTFKPERVAGHGIASRALIPICYMAVKNSPNDDGCDYPVDKSGASFQSGRSVALDSSVTLKSDVIGKTL
jgi:hypothetical protein